MSSETARKAEAGQATCRYERRRSERTLLYQLVAEHYPRFIELLAAQSRSLPKYHESTRSIPDIFDSDVP